jgi:arsenite-transporting ATPase
MPSIHVFEPALCCTTGVCGPDVDQALVDFTADVEHVRPQGADITRHNLAQDPLAFAQDETVRSFLEVAGSEGLPLTVVDGVTVLTGAYPTRDQLVKYAGLTGHAVPQLTVLGDTSAACGCGPGGCC